MIDSILKQPKNETNFRFATSFPTKESALSNFPPCIQLPGIGSPISRAGIVRLTSSGNYTWVFLKHNNKPLLITKTLKWFEQNLPDFIRVRKSELINPLYIQSKTNITNREVDVLMSDGHLIRISRRRIQSVGELLGK